MFHILGSEKLSWCNLAHFFGRLCKKYLIWTYFARMVPSAYLANILGLHLKIFWSCLRYMPSLQIPRGERCRRDKVKAWPRQAILAKKFSPRNCQMKPKKRSRNSKIWTQKPKFDETLLRNVLMVLNQQQVYLKCGKLQSVDCGFFMVNSHVFMAKKEQNWYFYGNNFQNIKMVEFANDITAGGTPGFVHFGRSHLRLFWYWAPRHYNPRPKKNGHK